MRPQAGIYEIVHDASGRRYIGSSTHVARRLRQHRARLERQVHESPHLQYAWTKYGGVAFTFAVREYVAEVERLDEREQVHLDAAMVAGAVFNIGTVAKVPRRGTKSTPAHCAAIGNALRGRKRSAATIAAMSAALKGRVHSPESIAKRAAIMTGRRLSVEHCRKIAAGLVGRRHAWTPDERARMSALKRGWRPTDDMKRKSSEASKGKPKSAAHAAKLRAHLAANRYDGTGRTRTPETRARQAEAARLSWANGKRRAAQKAVA